MWTSGWTLTLELLSGEVGAKGLASPGPGSRPSIHSSILSPAGFLDRGHISLVLHLLSLIFFAGLLAAIVVQSQDHLGVWGSLGGFQLRHPGLTTGGTKKSNGSFRRC